MSKDFDIWNEQKKTIDSKQSKILFKEREIWWCSIGVNVGQESCGKGYNFSRPILILKKLSVDSCIGLPLSTKLKSGSWFIDVTVSGIAQNILLHQIRQFSTKRFQRRLMRLDLEKFIEVKEKLKQLLELF